VRLRDEGRLSGNGKRELGNETSRKMRREQRRDKNMAKRAHTEGCERQGKENVHVRKWDPRISRLQMLVFISFIFSRIRARVYTLIKVCAHQGSPAKGISEKLSRQMTIAPWRDIRRSTSNCQAIGNSHEYL
jgi:hypothetical protein